MSNYSWHRIGQLWRFFEAPEHAGLSTDGKRFFLAERDDEAYAVIDIRTGKTLWQVQREQDYPPLPEWIENGHIEIFQGPAKGRYRIFGLRQSYPLAVDDIWGVALTINERLDEIALVDLKFQQEFQWLPYELPTSPENKWAVASFSDDGSTIAVLVDNAATFFALDGSGHAEIQTLTNQYLPRPVPDTQWVQIGGLRGAYEYPQHAGISTDGRLFMLVEYTGIDYFVIEVATQKIIWQSDWISGQYTAPELTEWVKDGFIEIKQGPASGRYRIFGLEYGQPLHVSQTSGLTLELDEDRSQLILRDTATMQERQRLNYRPSDDWTFASFSDDGLLIAVLANHAVTFFAPASHIRNT